jgi:hypothetical protein
MRTEAAVNAARLTKRFITEPLAWDDKAWLR